MSRLKNWGVEGADLTALERNAAARRLGSRTARLEDLTDLGVLTSNFKLIELTAAEEARRAAAAKVANERYKLAARFLERLNEGYLLADIIHSSGLSAPTVYRYLDEYVEMRGGVEKVVEETDTMLHLAQWRIKGYDEVQGAVEVQKRGDSERWFMDVRDAKRGAELFTLNGVSLREQTGTFPDDARSLVDKVRHLYRGVE